MKTSISVIPVMKKKFQSVQNHYASMLTIPKIGIIPERNFGFLYTDLDIFSITWEGAIDFFYISEILNSFFPDLVMNIAQTLSELKTRLNEVKIERVVNIVTRTLKEVNHFKFDLDIDIDTIEYRSWLSNFKEISFIRSDIIMNTPNKSYKFAFTAANKNVPVRGDVFPEAGILLPFEYQFEPKTLRWILNLHKYKNPFIEALDIVLSVNEIKKFLKRTKQNMSAGHENYSI